MQLPAPFVDYARALLGEAEYNRFSAALLEDEQPVSIRLNPQKWDNSPFSIFNYKIGPDPSSFSLVMDLITTV